MVAITKNSELYDKIFKNISLDSKFESNFPTYQEIADGFLDPSTKGLRLQQNRLNGDQASDISIASKFLSKDLILNTGSSAPINFPSTLIDGLFNVVQSAEVDVALTDFQITDKVMSNVPSYQFDKPKGIPGLVIGAALLTLTVTQPLVGLIASAIVGIATGIAKAIEKRKEKLDAAKEAHLAELYATFAPLQVGGSESDSALVQELRSIFRTNDWTNVYSPRFKGEWRGIERIGGFAFAPGSVLTDSSKYAADVGEKFEVTGGMGVIPGTDIVTSVIQVGLPYDAKGGDIFRRYMKKEGPNNAYGPDPRTLKNAWSLVQDVGTYFPSTGRLAAAWWTISLKEGNWYKFRIDTTRLHKEWANYCESGLNFIRQKCYKWTRGDLDGDYEAFFGSAIYYAIGAWAGRVNGGTTMHPNYEKLAKPIGYTRNELTKKNLYRHGLGVNSSNSGAFLPLEAITDQKGNFYANNWWCDSCLGSIYDRGYEIKAKLNDLRNRQEWDLYKTLSSAYCSQFDAAFVGDENIKLLNLLLSQRKILLTHSDRKKIIMDDVLEDEPGLQGIKNSQSWRQQLLDAGVPLVQPKSSKIGNFDLKISFGTNAPPDLNPPGEVNIDSGPLNPWDPNFKIKRKGRSTTKKSSSSAPILLAGAGVVGYYFLSK